MQTVRTWIRQPGRVVSLGWLGGVFLLAATRAGGGLDAAELTRDRRGAGLHGEVLQKAWGLLDRAEIQAARALFAQVAATAEALEPDRVQALMGLGWCGRFGRPRPDIELARRSFREVVTRYPEHPAAPWALIELGFLRVRKERGGGSDARPYFERVLEEYPDSPAIHEAVLRLAGTYFYDIADSYSSRGLALLEEHLEKHPDNPLAVVMHFRVAHWYLEALQDFERALPHSLYLAEHGMSDPYRWALIYWQVAEIYRLRLGRPDKAVPYYARIIIDSPRSLHVLSAKQRITELTGRPWEEVVDGHRKQEAAP